MGLADKLKEFSGAGQVCIYQALVDSLSKEDQIALENAWQKGVAQRIILRALRVEGHKTSNESIANHRSGNCRCPKN